MGTDITLSIKTSEMLIGNETVSLIPKLVSSYRAIEDTAARQEGNFFRVSVVGKNKPASSAGIAYLNELIVETKYGNGWKKIYSSGMKQYRGAYNWEIDNHDNNFCNPVILEENKDKALVAFRTGAGNIKIYSFSKTGGKSKKLIFNWSDYEQQQKRLQLVSDMLEDENLFRDYVENSFSESRWHADQMKSLNDGEIVLILAYHSSRDCDAASDYYKFFILVKGKGIAESEEIYSNLSDPQGSFSSTTVQLTSVDLKSINEKKIVVDLKLGAFHSYMCGMTSYGNLTSWKRSYKLSVLLS
ncbi:MAG: hypothetical protein NTY12_04260 [Candidatus Falkowbacteria bacterium]|nr:hypothetical protein [Candidatus Falkowbacteria bacterium]